MRTNKHDLLLKNYARTSHLSPRGRVDCCKSTMKRMHKVFFHGYKYVPTDYFVRVIASSYAEMQTILVESFYFLRHGNFAVVERGDGTFVCDDVYFQSLDPNRELLVLVIGKMMLLSIICGISPFCVYTCIDIDKTDGTVTETYVTPSQAKPSSNVASPTLKELVENSNFHISSLRISNVMGNVEMSSKEKPKSLHPCGRHALTDRHAPYNVSMPHNSLQFQLPHPTPHQLQDVPFIQYSTQYQPQASFCKCNHHICPKTLQHPVLSSQYHVSPAQIQIPPSQYVISSPYQHQVPIQSPSLKQIPLSQYQNTLSQPRIINHTIPQQQYYTHPLLPFFIVPPVHISAPSQYQYASIPAV